MSMKQHNIARKLKFPGDEFSNGSLCIFTVQLSIYIYVSFSKINDKAAPPSGKEKKNVIKCAVYSTRRCKVAAFLKAP